MNKFKKTAILIFLFLFLFSIPCFAQNTSEDYQFQIDEYNQQSVVFLTAKNQYLKLNSAASQNEAITETKKYLIKQANLLHSYFLLLISKLNQAPNLNSGFKVEYIKKSQDQLQIIDNYKKSIQSLENPKPEDLISLSDNFAKNQDSFVKLSQEIRFVLIQNKSTNNVQNLKSLKIELQNLSQGKNISGIDNLFLEVSSLEKNLDENLRKASEQIDLLKKELNTDDYTTRKYIESFNSIIDSLKNNLKKSLSYYKLIISELSN